MIPTIEQVERWAEAFVDDLLDDEPAILLEGPRGSGKSTLLRSIAQRRNALVLDLDDDSVLQLVREDVGSALASPRPDTRRRSTPPTPDSPPASCRSRRNAWQPP